MQLQSKFSLWPLQLVAMKELNLRWLHVAKYEKYLDISFQNLFTYFYFFSFIIIIASN